MKYISAMFEKLFEFLPLKRKQILFESRPDFSDNTFSIYEEFLREKLNLKYKLIWICFDGKNNPLEKQHNVKFIKYGTLKAQSAINRSKLVVTCNRVIYSKKKNQIVFYLGHGNPLKNTSSYFLKFLPNIDYFLCTSDIMANLRKNFYGVEEKKLVVLGYPRNDQLNKNIKIRQQIIGNSNAKIIAWLPTVRKISGGSRTANSLAFSQLLMDENNLKTLDSVAENLNVYIFIKMHFAEESSINFNKIKFRHIFFIGDEWLKEKNISSYEFLANTDALLSDYSSVIYDYTLVNKPIGLVWDDIKEFENSTGFVDGVYDLLNGCEKIYTMTDLSNFIKRISLGVDLLGKQREFMKMQVNKFTDFKNSKRVVDFIKEEILS